MSTPLRHEEALFALALEKPEDMRPAFLDHLNIAKGLDAGITEAPAPPAALP